MTLIDCRGLACPGPVLRTKDTIETEGLNEITVLVDNEAAKENVGRFLGSQGFDVSTGQEGNDFRISGKKMDATKSIEAASEKPDVDTQKIMVMVATNCMGHGDDKLGAKLMTSFLTTLKEMGNDLWRLVFVNNGVKLTIEGSSVLSVLKELEGQGILILVCGTCLNHFDLLDKKQVGETTNMLDIVTAMQLADKVINM
jgi:selenium metabolism protein YedF